MHISVRLRFAILVTALLSNAAALAQGSIHGTVQKSTGGSPVVSQFSFFGFLDNTDEEIRIMGADGSGYDGTNWWDDFQNYLTEGAGNPYDYYFFDSGSSQSFHLEKTIPSNSFQTEDIVLSPNSFPVAPVISGFSDFTGSTLRITWRNIPGVTFHVYRRLNGVHGSYFRRDNTSGNLGDHGVADTSFIDSQVDSLAQYEYTVIADNGIGVFSSPSAPFSIGTYVCGDADGSGNLDLSDAVFLINYIFNSGPAPDPIVAGDADCSGSIDTSDVVYLISFIFSGGPAPCANC